MSQLTTHILDTAIGQPAEGVPVSVELFQNDEWNKIAQGETDNNGRIANLFSGDLVLEPGTYRLIFDTEVYFKMRLQHVFYPRITVEFEINDNSHYHIPLLLSPYGYSTYRGS